MMSVFQMAGHEIDKQLHTGCFVNLSGERRPVLDRTAVRPAIERAVRATPGRLVLVDLEPVLDDAAYMADALWAVGVVRAVDPHVRVGLFAVPPMPQEAKEACMYGRKDDLAAWHDAIGRYASYGLLDVVDYLCPECYTSTNRPWQRWMPHYLERCRRYQKPMIVATWHRHCQIPIGDLPAFPHRTPQDMAEQCAYLRGRVEGVIWWNQHEIDEMDRETINAGLEALV